MKTADYLRRFDECASRASLFRDEFCCLLNELRGSAAGIHKSSCRSIARRINAIPHLADADEITRTSAQNAISALMDRANEPRKKNKAA